jgi:hypothetical protein
MGGYPDLYNHLFGDRMRNGRYRSSSMSMLNQTFSLEETLRQCLRFAALLVFTLMASTHFGKAQELNRPKTTAEQLNR